MTLSTAEFLVGQSVTAIRRNPLMAIAATTNVAVGVCVLGAFVLVALNLHHMADLEAKSAVITCELSGATPAADVEAALLRDPRVKDTRFVTKDDNLEYLAERLQRDIDALRLIPNPLPDTIQVYVSNPQEIQAVCDTAGKIRGVAKASYPQQVTEKILLVARGVDLAGLVVGGFLVLATLAVIGTTIRLTIYARRREIRIMQLVGATRWFIRLPFLLEGVFHGITGGVMAAAVLLAGYASLQTYVAENLEFMNLLYEAPLLVAFGAGLVLCGALFGAVGSLTGLHRHLRSV